MTPEKQILALESKLSNMSNDNMVLRRKLKLAIMRHGIYQALVDEMQVFVSPVEPLPKANIDWTKRKEIIEEHLVLHLSDEHADELVEPHKVGNLENFNFNVALCRAEKYVDTVLKFTQSTLINYRFPVLWILSYGDHVSGEIHGAVTHSHYKNMFRNSLAAGQMQALMIRDLAPYFKQINVLCLPGNHGRRSKKKDYEGAHDNWDYLVSEIARLHCASMKNVNFSIPDCFSCNVNINDWIFNIQHGDDIKSWNNIPFYGIERKTRRLVALHNATNTNITYFVMGHFHTCSSLADLNGETLINGSWIGTNTYSYEAFSGYREPCQWIHGVHKDHGISWRLQVKLKDLKNEVNGPQRYKINIASEVG